MHIISIISLAVLAGSAMAGPLAQPTQTDNVARAVAPVPTESADPALIPRAPGTVTCRPTSSKKNKNDPDKTYSRPVATDRAKFEMTNNALEDIGKKDSFDKGKSGDPHKFQNKDNIEFKNNDCDRNNDKLYEYPIFGDNAKKTWKKNTKASDQAGQTPMRIVFAKIDDEARYCGVMTHVQENADGKGAERFQLCT